MDEFNRNLAGQKRGPFTLPRLTLPTSYEFGSSTQTEDLRVSRVFVVREHYRVTMIGEVFKLFNLANLTGYSGNLVQTSSFGQPTARATQVFGSGGPRAFQLAARFAF